MDKEILTQIGLSPNESEVYLLLLKMQEALASEIAKKSSISRPHIYDTLAKLVDKGLTSYVLKNNRRYFRPANPEVLMEILRSRQLSLQKELPYLKQMYSPSKDRPKVEVYEGKEGLKSFLKDLLREEKDFVAFGPTAKWEEQVPIELKQFFSQRKKIGFKGRMLAPEGSKILKYHLNEYKFLPREFSSPATTLVYGDKTCFVLWLDTVISVLIDNKELADSFKSSFELMWTQTAMTYNGVKGVQNILTQILEERPKEVLIYGTSGASIKLFPKFIEKWHKKRIEYKIPIKMIYTNTKATKDRLKLLKKDPYYDVRLMPAGYESPVATFIYKNKVVLMAVTKDGFATIIEKKEITDVYRKQFQTLWNQSTPAKVGM